MPPTLFRICLGDPGNKKIVTDILMAGSVNVPHGGEKSLLIWSARKGDTQLAEALVADGADKEVLDHQNSEKAYRVAVRAGHFETARVIGPNDRPFNTFRYALTASVADLANLAEKSDHPNLAWGRSVLRGPKQPISVALYQSIIEGNRALFDAQIADGVDVNRGSENSIEYKALGWAVHYSRVDMAEILLKKGALLLLDAGGGSRIRHVLELAVWNCNLIMIDWLLNKMDRWHPILNEHTAFTLAALLRHSSGCGFSQAQAIRILNTMVAKGLNLESPVSAGGSFYPIDYAVIYGSFLLPRLLDLGASCSTPRPRFTLDLADQAIARGISYWGSERYNRLLRSRTTLEAHNCPRTPRPSSSAPEGGVVGESESDTRQQERDEALDEVIRQLEEEMEEARKQRPASPFPEGQ